MSSMDDLVLYESKPRDFSGGVEGGVNMVKYNHKAQISVMS